MGLRAALRGLTISLGIACLLIPIAAQARLPDEIEAKLGGYVRAEMERTGMPGVAMGIIKDGKLAYTRYWGLADPSNNVPVTADSLFALGSIDKPIMTIALLMLEREGKLKLDDKVGKFFPGSPSSWQSMTIRHLITNRSGIATVTYDGPGTLSAGDDDAEIVRKIQALPMRSKPGEHFEYNTTNFYFVSRIIAAAAGEPFEKFIARRIFTPLKMSHSIFSTEFGDDQKNNVNQVRGHYLRGDYTRGLHVVQQPNFTKVPPEVLYRSIYTNVEDMAKFVIALDGEQLLSQGDKARMWAEDAGGGAWSEPDGETQFGSGLTWELLKVNGHVIARKGGDQGGQSSDVIYVPDRRIGMVFFTNMQVLLDSFPLRDNISGGWVTDILLGIVDPELKRPHSPPGDIGPYAKENFEGF